MEEIKFLVQSGLSWLGWCKGEWPSVLFLGSSLIKKPCNESPPFDILKFNADGSERSKSGVKIYRCIVGC